MQPESVDYAADRKRKPARRLGVLLLIGLALCLAAFIAGIIIIVVYVGGG